MHTSIQLLHIYVDDTRHFLFCNQKHHIIKFEGRIVLGFGIEAF